MVQFLFTLTSLIAGLRLEVQTGRPETTIFHELEDDGEDAGATMATATSVPELTELIYGEIADGLDADLYRFELFESTSFTIQAHSMDEELDISMLLFDGEGHGIMGVDDWEVDDYCTLAAPPNAYDACVSRILEPGVYFFGVGRTGLAAFASQADYESATPFLLDTDTNSFDRTEEVLELIGNDTGPTDRDFHDVGRYWVLMTPVPVCDLACDLDRLWTRVINFFESVKDFLKSLWPF